MTNIKYISHASVLIQEDENFILTDPWFQKPAFGSWLPTPPMSIHPAYLLTLANCNNFSLAISHGHDDHIDDDFLSMFPTDTKILIPEYGSKGFLYRIKQKGFENIVEVPNSGFEFDCFKLRSYINLDISRDDAMLSIETPSNFIVHANDNWQEIVGDNLQQLKEDANRFYPEQKLYMSQCNLADGWPNVYRNYTEEEKKDIHANRVNNIIDKSLLNAHNINAKHFLNYAGHASAFVKEREDLKEKVSFKSNNYIQKICKDAGYSVDVLDMIPGDSFDFENVKKQFGDADLCVDILKEESFSFYEKYGNIYECDSYKQYASVSSEDISSLLNEFLQGFEEFVLARVGRTNFNTDIIGHTVMLGSDDESCTSEILIGDSPENDVKIVKFFVTKPILSELLLGNVNWENLYIGYAAEVETSPKDLNARAVIRWLSMYGYVYQRNQRLQNA